MLTAATVLHPKRTILQIPERKIKANNFTTRLLTRNFVPHEKREKDFKPSP